MSDADRGSRSARLLIRISSAAEAESTISVAVDLAGALGTELAGFYVEEESWFAASAFPFPAMVAHSGAPLQVTPARIAAAMQREAAACRRLFAHAAERARLHWSFQAERGEWLKLLGTALGPEDILMLRRDALAGLAGGVVDLALKLAPPRGGVLLLPRRNAFIRREIVVLSGAGGEPARLGEAAARLAARLGVTVLGIDLSERPDLEALSRRIDQAWLVIASLDRLAERANLESELLQQHFRTPLLLLRTPNEG